jgi:hypothetical protein
MSMVSPIPMEHDNGWTASNELHMNGTSETPRSERKEADLVVVIRTVVWHAYRFRVLSTEGFPLRKKVTSQENPIRCS